MKSSGAVAASRRYVQRARAQATEATASRIADAFLTRLLKEWFDEITLDRVAADAGVTVQTVVRRFGGKDGLLAEAVKVLGARITAHRFAAGGTSDSFVENLVGDYEQTGDAVIRLLALERRHPAVRSVTAFGRREHRRSVERAFAEPLAALGEAACTRALDALVIATDVYVWKLLRRDMRRSVVATMGTMKRLVRATIADFTNANAAGDE